MNMIRENIEELFKEEWSKGLIDENPINKLYMLATIRDKVAEYEMRSPYKSLRKFVRYLYVRELDRMIKELNSKIFE